VKSTSNCFSSFCIAWKHRSSNDFPHCRSKNTTFVKRHLIKTQKIIMYSEWCSVTDDMTAYCDPCFEKHTRYFAHIDHYGSLFREDSIIHTANQFGRCFRKQQKNIRAREPVVCKCIHCSTISMSRTVESPYLCAQNNGVSAANPAYATSLSCGNLSCPIHLCRKCVLGNTLVSRRTDSTLDNSEKRSWIESGSRFLGVFG